VDDGIAMGSTVQAAVRCCRNLGAVHITVAAPVGSPDAVASLKETADDVFVLFSPPSFRAVADFYRDWYDVSDREVFEIMRTAARARMLAPESLRREYGFRNTN
jgi:putative phosphoribosyl transferase